MNNSIYVCGHVIFRSKYSFGEISPLLISLSFHTSLTKSHLPIHIQKLIQWEHLRSHNHLRYKLVLLLQKALKVSLQLEDHLHQNGTATCMTYSVVLCQAHSIPGQSSH